MELLLQVFASLSFITFVKGSIDPSNLACTAINSTTVEVTWTQASDASVSGYHLNAERVDGLRIEFGLPSIDLNHITFDKYTLYGLGKFAIYNVTLHSYFTSGANGTDYVISCQTSSDLPDASNFNFSCDGITTTSIRCDWDALNAVYWNGVPQGYQLRYIGLVNAYYTDINLTTSDLTYTITGLTFDTWYILHLRTMNDVGFSPYTSTYAKTLGWNVTVENKTRYFCYETIPDRVEWEWEEMPCTVYVGIILAFMLLSIIFMMLSCILCCCKGKEETKNNMAINIFNEQGNDDREDLYDDSDDDYDRELTEEEDDDDEDDFEDEYDYDSEGNPTEAAINAKKKRKLKEAYNGGGASDIDDETESEMEPEYETSEVPTESDEEYSSSEGDDDLDEEDRDAKREKKLAAIAAAKELRQKKREEKAQRKAEHDAERAKQKAENEEIKAKRKKEKEEEKAKRIAEKERKAKQKAEEAKLKKEANAKKKEELKQKKANTKKGDDNKKEEDDFEESDCNSDDFDTSDYSDSEETDADEKEDNKLKSNDDKKDTEKKDGKKALVVKPINSKKKVSNLSSKGITVHSTVNEVDDTTKKKSITKNGKGDTKNASNVKNSKPYNKVKAGKTDGNKSGMKNKQKNESGNHHSRDSDSFGDDDDDDSQYYEDWDPDAEHNPEITVTKVNVDANDIATSDDKKKSNNKQSTIKNKTSSPTHKNKRKNTSRPTSKSKNTDSKEKIDGKNKESGQSEDEEYTDDSDGYDSDDDEDDSDEYDYSSEETTSKHNAKKGGHVGSARRVINKTRTSKGGYTTSDDSGRGSALSNDWGYEGHDKTKVKPVKKKTGFFGSLFGKSTKVTTVKQGGAKTTHTSNGQMSNQKTSNTISNSDGNSNSKKSCGNSDWDSEDDIDENNGANIPSPHKHNTNSIFGNNNKWPGHAQKGNEYTDNGKQFSDFGSNSTKTAQNSKLFAVNTTTDFGDWASDNDDVDNGVNNTRNGSDPSVQNTLNGNSDYSVPNMLNGNRNLTFGNQSGSNSITNPSGTGHQTSQNMQQNQGGLSFNSNGNTALSNTHGNIGQQSNKMRQNGGFIVNPYVQNQGGYVGATGNGFNPSMDSKLSVHGRDKGPKANDNDRQSGEADNPYFQSGKYNHNGNGIGDGNSIDNAHRHGDVINENGRFRQENYSGQLVGTSEVNFQLGGKSLPTNNNMIGSAKTASGLYNPNAQSGWPISTSGNGINDDNNNGEQGYVDSHGKKLNQHQHYPDDNAHQNIPRQGNTYDSAHQVMPRQGNSNKSVHQPVSGRDNLYDKAQQQNPVQANQHNDTHQSMFRQGDPHGSMRPTIPSQGHPYGNAQQPMSGQSNPYSSAHQPMSGIGNSNGSKHPLMPGQDNAFESAQQPNPGQGYPTSTHNPMQGQRHLNALAPDASDPYGMNNQNHPQTSANRPYYGNGNDNLAGAAPVTARIPGRPNKGKKLVSFRTNAASPTGPHDNNSGQHGPNARGVSNSAPVGFGGMGNNGAIMPDADITLPDTKSYTSPRSPVGKFIANKGAWDKGTPVTSNAEKHKGSKTPVEELFKPSKRLSLTEPEPIFETDRLAKKFPFLNPKNSVDAGKGKGKGNNGNNSNQEGMRKNQSDSNLPMFLAKPSSLKNSKSTGDFKSMDKVQTLPNVPSDINDNGKNPEKGKEAVDTGARDQLFYGFGVGRWRLAAAKWLNKWKMKRRPVKTANSTWE